jgi:hypothetical protein
MLRRLAALGGMSREDVDKKIAEAEAEIEEEAPVFDDTDGVVE